MKLIKWSKDGAEVNVIRGSLLDHARNLAVKHFLKTKNHTFLFIDDDTVPDVKDLKKLLKHKKDMIGGLYNCVMSKADGSVGTKPSAFTLIPPGIPLMDAVSVIPKTGMQKVVGMGTGYMMVKRHVFEKVAQPWFEFIWVDKAHTAFAGEDMTFCKKVQDAGITIWCDTDCLATHSKELLI